MLLSSRDSPLRPFRFLDSELRLLVQALQLVSLPSFVRLLFPNSLGLLSMLQVTHVFLLSVGSRFGPFSRNSAVGLVAKPWGRRNLSVGPNSLTVYRALLPREGKPPP